MTRPLDQTQRRIDAGLRLLRGARAAGLPFLRAVDGGELRGLAAGVRTAWLRARAPTPPARPPGAAASVRFAERSAADAIVPLPDARAAFAAKLAAIAGATSSIDMMLYYLADDAAGRELAAALAAAAARGVRVRLAADRLAMEEKQLAYPDTPNGGALGLAAVLARQGIQVVLAGDPSFCLHRKLLLVDDAAAVFGGRNVADHYVDGRWRDLELAIQGPLATALGRAGELVFEGSGVFATTAAAPGVLLGAPGTHDTGFLAALAALVGGARRSLVLEHAYLLSHPWLEAAVADAVARGVRVRVFTNSAATNDLPVMGFRASVAALALHDRGAEVYLRTPPAATLHTKLAVADERRILFGSSNLDYYTGRYCAELDLALDDAGLGAYLVALFDLALTERTTERVVEGGPLHAALVRHTRGLSVSRAFDALFRDLQ